MLPGSSIAKSVARKVCFALELHVTTSAAIPLSMCQYNCKPNSKISNRPLTTSSVCFTLVPRWKAALTTLRGADHVVDAEEAKNFVVLLQPNERELILRELTAFEEGKPGDDTPPTKEQLRRLMIYSGLPFVGFGFLDNFLMIVAGSYIEVGIGMVFTISTMAAAALGNAVSDVAGVGSASYVEHLSRKLGSGPPPLTAKQIDMRSTRWRMSLGRGLGVAIGCILGMFPLLFYTEKKPCAVVVTDEVTVVTKT
ncbi:putative Transmembrane protein 65 [Hypsibius exemplaris]|uniref:Transmembrane protein 65 n=1 Tax=Hypsibius exemplaris TaxID=2072580 RepID=A0A1W0WYM7_HYPEX|nr:putative Transmembrane protein 65 [Hypsibius exemplaris]